MSPETLVHRCLDEGIDVLAVTDHHEIGGALAVRAAAPFTVIVGEEVRTAEGGEIIGLFLTERIPAGLPAPAVIAVIRAQGGLIYLPHPYDRVRGTRWEPHLREALLNEADIIEVFNARNLSPAADAAAAAAAGRLGKAAVAGADAHHPAEIGRTVTFLPPFSDPPSLLTALRQATLHGERTPAHVRFASALARLRHRSGGPARFRR